MRGARWEEAALRLPSPLSHVVRAILIRWWDWARAELQRRRPMDPDLNRIVLRLRQLRAGE